MTSTALPRIGVSEQNPHLLATSVGAPFFWLGDTAWELFHRCSREEAARYFANRQRLGFNVVQAVALAEFDGLHAPNFYGDRPLVDDDPRQPNDPYFRYVDELLDLAAEHQLYVAFLPTWGDKVNRQSGGPIIFNSENAFDYGKWLGERYRGQSNLIWMLGGDRQPVVGADDYRPIWRALAAGIRAGAGGQPLITFHIAGGAATSALLHGEEWLAINTMQSGHGSGHDVPVWEWIERDYALDPIKPTLDAEPNYEDHPVNPWPVWDPTSGYFRDYDVRKQIYRSVFAGACGVTYGHHAVWQFYGPRHERINYADRPWTEAIDRPGAAQAGHLRRLIESRPYFTRVPDQGMLVSPAGEGGSHVRATRDAAGGYALVYIPTAGQSVTLDLRVLGPGGVRASWVDPRTGAAAPFGDFAAGPSQAFTSPADGPDWVLALDRVG